MLKFVIIVLASGVGFSSYAKSCDQESDVVKVALADLRGGDIEKVYLGKIKYIEGGGRENKHARYEVPYATIGKFPDGPNPPIAYTGKLIIWRSDCSVESKPESIERLQDKTVEVKTKAPVAPTPAESGAAR